MRDPMARKLFQSREAREKLRGMGGIMASSPELAQTVAQFNDGGDVTVPVVPTYSDWMQMSRTERRRAGLPESFIGGQMFFNRFGVGMGTNDPETGARIPFATPPEAQVAPVAPMQGAELTELGIPPDVISTLSVEEIDNILNYDDPTQAMRDRFTDFPQPGPIPEAMNPIVEYFGDVLGSEAPREARAERAAAIRERDAARAVTASQMEEEALAGDAERARSAAEIIEEDVDAGETDAGETDAGDNGQTPPAGPGTGTAAQTGLEGTGAAIGRGDFDTTYEQMLGRLQSVMGTEDKDSREKAMANLAMIGLAIAAGQSPNALTNIAQGALVGMKGIQEAEAAETANERAMRLEAMRLAASEVELSRRLASQERIAGMRAGSGTGTYTLERLYQQNMGAILQNPDMFDVFTEDNVVDPNKVTSLARSLSERGMSLGSAGDQQYTPGQLVVQDGVTYEYQQDGTWQPAGE